MSTEGMYHRRYLMSRAMCAGTDRICATQRPRSCFEAFIFHHRPDVGRRPGAAQAPAGHR